MVDAHKKVGAAIDLMQRYGISQLPVVRSEPVGELTDVVGSLQERSLLDRVFRNPDALNDDVAVAMQPPLAAVDARASASTRSSPSSPGPGRPSWSPGRGARLRSSPGRICSSFWPRSGRRSRRRTHLAAALAPGRDHDRADDQRGAEERRRAGALVEEQRAERHGDERIHVLVRHDLRDRRVVEQPDVGREPEHRADDKVGPPRSARARVPPRRSRSARRRRWPRSSAQYAAEHLVDRGDERVLGSRTHRDAYDPLDQEIRGSQHDEQPDSGRAA